MKKYLILKNYSDITPTVVAECDNLNDAKEYTIASSKIDKEHSYSVAVVEFTTELK